MQLTKREVLDELAAPAMRDAQRAERAAEVARIVAHANTKSTMGAADDEVARPLFTLLKEHRIIPSDASGHLEWQAAWEFGIASYFYGDDDCLNVYVDGSFELC